MFYIIVFLGLRLEVRLMIQRIYILYILILVANCPPERLYRIPLSSLHRQPHKEGSVELFTFSEVQ